ncbi:MAG TPA: hypothetical protein EYN67_09170 [Flavobacteriales bacterium]|nr:hypothetical protein [Flavobacteriales bacterium]
MSYTYKVWNDGRVCNTHCYISIKNKGRVITEMEFVKPSFFDVITSSSNKLIEKMLKKGRRVAQERISILEINERS